MTIATDPGFEMQMDSHMLTQAGAGYPSIRLYRWSTVCVTLGNNQSPRLALVDPYAIRWANRPTGGGAVLHGHDLTLSAAIPMTARPKLRTLYTAMAQFAIDFLAAHGLEAVLSGAEETKTNPEYCFARTAPSDVVERATGTKICGCALRTSHRSALLQTSIPYKAPEVDPGEIIMGAKWIGTPEWRPDESFNPESLPSWQALLKQAWVLS